MSKYSVLFIGGFSNPERWCQYFGSELAERTGWEVNAVTFREAVKSPKTLLKNAKADIVITHSASVFLLDESEIKPKLYIAHSPPSNIRRREFIYRYLIREAKRFFKLNGALFGRHDLFVMQMPRLLRQINECDLEHILSEYNKWCVISPKRDPLFKYADYPESLRNSGHFVRTDSAYDDLFHNPDETIDAIENIVKSHL